MCAIIDNDVSDELVKKNPSAIGKHFRNWLATRKGKLVVGGKLLQELQHSAELKRWISARIRAGIVRHVNDKAVDDLAQEIADTCRSNDAHVVALARISGARLLYTGDRRLMDDFRNKELLGGRVRGRIYNANVGKDTLTDPHKTLLNRTDLCESKR